MHSSGFILVALISGLAQSACSHRAPTMFGGCSGPTPLVGPPSQLTVIRSAGADSGLVGKDSGQLVVHLTWSSDSLARTSHPYGGVIHLGNRETGWRTSRSIGPIDTVIVPTLASNTRLAVTVESIGARSVYDTLTARRGYTDTITASLQFGGMTLCA